MSAEPIIAGLLDEVDFPDLADAMMGVLGGVAANLDQVGGICLASLITRSQPPQLRVKWYGTKQPQPTFTPEGEIYLRHRRPMAKPGDIAPKIPKQPTSLLWEVLEAEQSAEPTHDVDWLYAYDMTDLLSLDNTSQARPRLYLADTENPDARELSVKLVDEHYRSSILIPIIVNSKRPAFENQSPPKIVGVLSLDSRLSCDIWQEAAVGKGHVRFQNALKSLWHITALVTSTLEVLDLAFYDFIAGDDRILSRAFFYKKLDVMISRRSSANQGRVFLFYCDLNDFKFVNDVHGHSQGDLIIRDFARQLRDFFETTLQGPTPSIKISDFWLCRLGGDEFGLLLEVKDQQLDKNDLVRLLQAKMPPHFTTALLNGDRIPLTMCVGLVSLDRVLESPHERYRWALKFEEYGDRAMYLAKQIFKERKENLVVSYDEHFLDFVEIYKAKENQRQKIDNILKVIAARLAEAASVSGEGMKKE